MTKNYKWVIIVILLVLIVGSLWYWREYKGKVDTSLPITQTFKEATTLEGNFSVLDGTRVVVASGATLTVNGDVSVQGLLECDGGPLNLRVKGKFSVEKEIKCNRPDTLPEGDVGDGIVVVAQLFDIAKEAVIVSNGHVQMVTDASNLALTPEALTKLYDEAGKYRGEKWHIGPLTPLEEVPMGAKGRPVSLAPAFPKTMESRVKLWQMPFINAVYAQEPAVDNQGKPVPGAVKIGGTWIVGNPNAALPPNVSVPTPPKGINKIILNFNFGNNGVTFQNFNLTGPDGRPGTDGKGCNAQGSKGESAMRLLVKADNITINNFDLHLGSGGAGGNAITPNDCYPKATAVGGVGGEPGNFKMIAEEKFDITGAFNIFPGQGGIGGKAVATGKKGDDGCGGKFGAEATATGGNGGDSNKVLTVSGNVGGLSNVTVNEMVGGQGGDGTANSGAGGHGTGPGCSGGPGGKATANGGKGGNTTCAKFACKGGDGGDAEANPGVGGNGGQGDSKNPGGPGGKGGNAAAKEGQGGTGKTANGDKGTIIREAGGNGGNGGDGCLPGGGGAGGNGKPNGNKGADGKNLCVIEKKPDDIGIISDPGKPIEEIAYVISQSNFSFIHNIGATQCPQPIGSFNITASGAPTGARWEVSVPSGQSWLQITSSGTVNGSGGQLTFTCQLQQYQTQSLSTSPTIIIKDASGKILKQFTATVKGQINAQQ